MGKQEELIGRLEEDIQFWVALTLHSENPSTNGHFHFRCLMFEKEFYTFRFHSWKMQNISFH